MHIPFFRNNKNSLIKNLPKQVPRSMVLEITSQCNFNCPYCYCLWHEFPQLLDQTLTSNQWKKIIEELLQHKVEDFTFTGGEALLFPRVLELLSFTRKKSPNSSITLFSNGLLVDDDTIGSLKDLKVNLAISLQGITSYNSMTESNYSYKRVLTLIEKCKIANINISISTVVTKLNKFEISDIFIAAATKGASFIQLGPMLVQGKGKNRLDLALSKEEWLSVKEEIRNLKDYKTPYAFCDEMICNCRKHPIKLMEQFSSSKIVPCNAGIISGVISPNGLYRKCLHYFEEDILTN